ncbi:MAG: hypothetical protein ACNI25_06895 [Halarcobacter sp.]
MKKIIYIFLSFFIVILFSACAESMESQKEQCIKNGDDFKIEKRLNFRTGEYEIKLICVKSHSK